MLNPTLYNGPQPLSTRQENARVTNRVQFLPGPLPERWLAITDDARRALVALDRACEALNPSVTEEELRALLARISTVETSLVQAWKLGAVAPTVPTPWKNPVTGELLPNPWLSELSDAAANKAKEILLRTDPELAQAFKALADNPYGFVAEQRAAEARRTALRKITYDSKDHDKNPFLDNTVSGSQRQAEWIASHPGDGVLLEIYKWEARPVSLPWATAISHRSECGLIIESLLPLASPLPGIAPDSIMLGLKFDGKIRDSERLAAENEAKAASARAAALRT